MKKQWNILRGFTEDNRGSGIVVVLVSMVCVALMGASLLFMSYTAIRLKATERQASKDFYTAETALDEIRAGVQTVVSEAIATSYKFALENYGSGAQITSRFQERFRNDLDKAGLFDYSNGTQRYDLDLLKSYVSSSRGVTIESVGNARAVEKTTDAIVLKDIKVTYTANNGYTTEICTDISIGLPAFAYIMSATSISGLPQHALIAKVALEQSEGASTIEIDGSAYAGKLELAGDSGSKMTITDGTVVCAGDVVVDGSPTAISKDRLATDQLVKFWAGRIVVKGGSSVNLGGETRVLDDLELAGSQSKATLKGSYYGFGDGSSDNGTMSGSGQANRSSAILINGLNSELKVSDLDRLMLAGRSYIGTSFYANDTTQTGVQSVGMMESISARSNQQMYLIDPSYLNGVDQNPAFTDGAVTVTLNTSGADLATRYGFKLAQRSYNYFNGQKINYYYMEFEDPTSANEYYEECFAKTGNKMANYLGIGSNLNVSGINTLGYIIRGKDGNYTLNAPNDAIRFDCSGMRSTFNQLKRTLIDANTDLDEEDDGDDPYDYIIDEDAMATVSGQKEFYLGEGADKKLVGIVTNGAYVFDGSSGQNDLRLIIAKGDVTVSANYEGLIICGGTIHIRGNITMTANEDAVSVTFGAMSNDGATMSDYIAHGASVSGGGEDDEEEEEVVNAGNVDGWNLDTIVTYSNWSKN